MECVTEKCSQDVLALSGGLALAPPLISSVAFTRGTSWSSSRNTFKPFSRTTCRLTGELRVFLVQCKQTVCAPPVGLLQSMQMTLLKSTWVSLLHQQERALVHNHTDGPAPPSGAQCHDSTAVMDAMTRTARMQPGLCERESASQLSLQMTQFTS